jgi:Restriction endonuclease NotI
MALKIVEFFGYEPLAPQARPFVEDLMCPFTRTNCIKPNHGSCSVRQSQSRPIICCPNRLYADNYRALREITVELFGPTANLITAAEARSLKDRGELTGDEVVAFGKGWGGELALPRPRRSDGGQAGSYYVDWILAKIAEDGTLVEFTALEVQTIDTTGSYRDQSNAFFAGVPFEAWSNSGMNWENVNKRILPQLIYKGHVLRREARCSKGLFFICPQQVYDKIRERLGNALHQYPVGPGTISFRSYELGPEDPVSAIRSVKFNAQFTTTVDQVATAFTSPIHLPDQDVYAAAINLALR